MDRLENRLRRTLGHHTTEEHKIETINRKQWIIDNILIHWAEVGKFVWWMNQTYGDENEPYNVLGSSQSIVENFQKADQDEGFDFYLTYAVANEDPEIRNAQLDNVLKAFQFDRATGTSTRARSSSSSSRAPSRP